LNITVVRESWRLHPLAWIHRAEARSIAEELRRAGHTVRLVRLQNHSLSDLPPSLLLLRVSDPVMLLLVQALTRAGKFYLGPHADVMARCYDKYEAHRIATSNGLDSPATALASEAGTIPIPLVLKPRRGSDSIGVRLLKKGPIPARLRTDRAESARRCALSSPRERPTRSSASIFYDLLASPSPTPPSPRGCAVHRSRSRGSSGSTGRRVLT
jgi:hypothetical protein